MTKLEHLQAMVKEATQALLNPTPTGHRIRAAHRLAAAANDLEAELLAKRERTDGPA